MQGQQLQVNVQRLKDTIEQFATFGQTVNQGVTRLALSDEDILARNYFKDCCEALGMTVVVDDVGCMYATLPGTENKPPIIMGSHLDSVKKGGKFDGVLGVIAGLEVVRTLVDNGVQPKHPITIVNFTNEEGARFEPSMMASGIISNKFNKEEMFQKTDSDGISFGMALKNSGYEGDINNRLSEAYAFLEMHIEQGPILESENIEIGVVECVVGMICYEIEITGESDHAGTTPMHMRKDALFAANNYISKIRSQIEHLDENLVFTIGRMNVLPNIHTVIPNKVTFSVEARHKDETIIQTVEEILKNAVSLINQEGCHLKVSKLWDRRTVWFDAALCQHIEEASNTLGYSNKRMVSGAGHDAQFIASTIPTAMIFVPSAKGKSHCEEEYTSLEQCEQGVNVLLETVLQLLK